MNLPDPEDLLVMLSVFIRAGTFLLLIPAFGRPVPILVRVAIAIFLAVAVTPILGAGEGGGLPTHWGGLVVLVVKESFIGFMMSVAVAFTFYLCQMAGQFISMEIGLIQSNLFNPLMSEQQSVLSTGMTLLALALLFSLNLHHLFLAAFIQSFEVVPAGAGQAAPISVEQVVNGLGKLFLLATQMAAPFIAVNFIITLSFAILGRAVPAMNVLILSFSARIGVGLFILTLVFLVLAQFLLGALERTPDRMLQFLPMR